MSSVVRCSAAMPKKEFPRLTIWESLPAMWVVESTSSRFISPTMRRATGAEDEVGKTLTMATSFSRASANFPTANSSWAL